MHLEGWVLVLEASEQHSLPQVDLPSVASRLVHQLAQHHLRVPEASEHQLAQHQGGVTEASEQRSLAQVVLVARRLVHQLAQHQREVSEASEHQLAHQPEVSEASAASEYRRLPQVVLVASRRSLPYRLPLRWRCQCQWTVI